MTTNSDGKVHVNSYEKDDGTKVKEHYRSAPNSGNYEYRSDTGDAYNAVITGGENGELPSIWIENYTTPGSMHKGGVVYNDRIEPNENNVQDEELGKINKVIGTAKNIVKLAVSAFGVLSKSQKEQLNQSIKTMEDLYQKSVKREQTTLNYLTKTKSQLEYKKLFDKYVKLRESNAKKHESLNKIRYAVSNDDYESVLSGLDNYKSNFDEVVNKNRTMNPLPRDNRVITDILNDNFTLMDIPKLIINADNYKLTPKTFVDVGMYCYNTFVNNNQWNDAKEMWKASSHDFAQSRNYVNENGSLVYSITDLPSEELRTIVQRKLNQQLNVVNSIGMIFHSNSDLSKQISVSPEFKAVFQKHKQELLNGQVVTGESTNFLSNGNITKALGHADFVYTYIDTNGDLCSLVLDTYDMNKGDSNWKVRIARAAQDNGAIRNYYSLNVVKTPKDIWEKWL